MTSLSDTERETLANPLYDDYNEDVESIIGHACQGCPAKRIINGRARPGKCACPGTPDIRDNLAEAAEHVIAAREQAATLAERERLLGVIDEWLNLPWATRPQLWTVIAQERAQ